MGGGGGGGLLCSGEGVLCSGGGDVYLQITLHSMTDVELLLLCYQIKKLVRFKISWWRTSKLLEGGGGGGGKEAKTHCFS